MSGNLCFRTAQHEAESSASRIWKSAGVSRLVLWAPVCYHVYDETRQVHAESGRNPSRVSRSGALFRPAGCAGFFAEVCGEFAAAQWADRVVGPYNTPFALCRGGRLCPPAECTGFYRNLRRIRNFPPGRCGHRPLQPNTPVQSNSPKTSAKTPLPAMRTEPRPCQLHSHFTTFSRRTNNL